MEVALSKLQSQQNSLANLLEVIKGKEELYMTNASGYDMYQKIKL